MPVPMHKFAMMANAGTNAGRAAYSDDAQTWTQSNPPTFLNGTGSLWVRVVYSPSLDLLVGVASSIVANNNNIIARSHDGGETWIGCEIPNLASWNFWDVCWAEELGLFVAVSGGGPTGNQRIVTSPDGVTWTIRSIPSTSKSLNGVCWSKELGLLLVVGSSNYIITSPDGINWTERTPPATSRTWSYAVWAGGSIQKFCVVASEASSTNNYMYSSDGVSWTQKGLTSSSLAYRRIDWSEDLDALICVGGTTGVVARSTDGINWTEQASGIGSTPFQAVCWSKTLQLWAICGNSVVRTSSDGIGTNWDAHTAPSLTWKAIVALDPLPPPDDSYYPPDIPPEDDSYYPPDIPPEDDSYYPPDIPPEDDSYYPPDIPPEDDSYYPPDIPPEDDSYYPPDIPPEDDSYYPPDIPPDDSYYPPDIPPVSLPFTFAWAIEGEEFGSQHIRMDEDMVGFELIEVEADVPALRVTIRNPRVGLLAPDRQIWAWFGMDLNWPDVPDVVPLLFGRVFAVPQNFQGLLVKVDILARPSEFEEMKAALAEGLRNRPHWDPLWLTPEKIDDPDSVLEARTAAWHVHRVTHAVTLNDLLNGEDGTLTVGAHQIFADSLNVTYGEAPARRVEIDATVSWDQAGAGQVDISDMLGTNDPYTILTYTGAGLVTNWPKPGQRFGGGWEVVEGSLRRVDGSPPTEWGYKGEGLIAPGYHTFSKGRWVDTGQDDYKDVIVPEWASAGLNLSWPFPARALRLYRWQLVPKLVLGYNVTRRRGELLALAIEADVQHIASDPGNDNDVIRLSFASSELTSPIDPGDAMPIGDLRHSGFFNLERGQQAIEYFMMIGRAHLCMRARAVQIEFTIPGRLAVEMGITCRHSMVIEHPHLPGGQAGGKVTRYILSLDGNTGAFICKITLAAMVGRGGVIEAVEGEPTYVDDDYVEPDYQSYVGQYVMPVPGEVAYEDQQYVEPTDDGVDLFRVDRRYVTVQKGGDWLAQEVAMGEAASTPKEVFDRLDDYNVVTRYALTLTPLTGGPFHTVYTPGTTLLKIPKTIDLEWEG